MKATHRGTGLWNALIGWPGDPHVSPLHLASYAVIGRGFWLIAAAWTQLHSAAKLDRLASTGPYASQRHRHYQHSYS